LLRQIKCVGALRWATPVLAHGTWYTTPPDMTKGWFWLGHIQRGDSNPQILWVKERFPEAKALCPIVSVTRTDKALPDTTTTKFYKLCPDPVDIGYTAVGEYTSLSFKVSVSELPELQTLRAVRRDLLVEGSTRPGHPVSVLNVLFVLLTDALKAGRAWTVRDINDAVIHFQIPSRPVSIHHARLQALLS